MGVKSKKKAHTRLDAYYRLAKDQGYRARSAFKLIQLNRKYDFLSKCQSLVDLCAAPGGWCQVAAKYMPAGSTIIGVDLVPIAPIKGCKTFVGDITEDRTRKVIQKIVKNKLIDCVVHDGAPNVGGVWSRDLFQQNALVLSSIKLACELLKPDGWFVSKVFRSNDFNKLLFVLKQLFTKVEATKPLASRMESAEIFVVCAGYKSPKKIDPLLFNPQKVFEEVGEEKILNNNGILVTPHSKVPMGYEEFATIPNKVINFKSFLLTRDPKIFLKSYHELRFVSSEEKKYLNSKHSKKDLIYLCGDLQQVSDGDLRRLLRWREQLIKEFNLQDQVGKEPRDQQEDAEEGEEDEDGDMDSVQNHYDSDAEEEGAEVGDSDEEEDEIEFDFDSPEGVTRIAQELLEIRKKNAKLLKKKQKKIVDRKLKQIKGLINYDPNSIHEEVGTGEAYNDDDGDGGDDDDDGIEGDGRGKKNKLKSKAYSLEAEDDDNEENFTVERLKEIDEKELPGLMDSLWMEAEEKGNDPLAPVMSVNLSAQEDWDFGKEKEEGDEEKKGKKKSNSFRDTDPRLLHSSAQLVEGEEDDMDVDNYGNYIPAERSARVKIFEEGLLDDDEEEEGDENDTTNNKNSKKKANAMDSNVDPSTKAAAGDSTGKESKWKKHHASINKILDETFPVPKEKSSAKEKKKRSRLLEAERISMDASKPLSLLTGPATKKNRFEDHISDDELNDDSSESNISSFSDKEEWADDYADELSINNGRVDSRKKKRIVQDMGQLTTQELIRQQRRQTLLSNKEIRKNKKKASANTSQGKDKKEDTTFEEIPIAMTDPNVRARTLAIATAMLDPAKKRKIIDASINRYVYNDDDELPDWFIKDEQRNCKVMLPITAEEIEAQRMKFKELNARPSKKIMEAIGRKRKRAQRLLQSLNEKGKSDPRAREKANGLSIRKLMRSQAIKGNFSKKKKNPLDKKSMGERKREKQRLKRKR